MSPTVKRARADAGGGVDTDLLAQPQLLELLLEVSAQLTPMAEKLGAIETRVGGLDERLAGIDGGCVLPLDAEMGVGDGSTGGAPADPLADEDSDLLSLLLAVHAQAASMAGKLSAIETRVDSLDERAASLFKGGEEKEVAPSPADDEAAPAATKPVWPPLPPGPPPAALILPPGPPPAAPRSTTAAVAAKLSADGGVGAASKAASTAKPKSAVWPPLPPGPPPTATPLPIAAPAVAAPAADQLEVAVSPAAAPAADDAPASVFKDCVVLPHPVSPGAPGFAMMSNEALASTLETPASGLTAPTVADEAPAADEVPVCAFDAPAMAEETPATGEAPASALEAPAADEAPAVADEAPASAEATLE
ncbi:hypothetical protein T492DRAFT_942252 [Pavlovales sp. CCMP2436]|nr:hypothetical protein T492DRAFT_942252 [Pavlovales sp. CCMP2436]